MSPIEARIVQLVAELSKDWDLVNANLEKAQTVDPAKSGPDAAYVAVGLHHAYQAFETLLSRLERALGLAERSSGGWHVEMLDAAAYPLPGLRPAVFPTDVRLDWMEVLRFRHFLRHAYAVELSPEKLKKNRAHLERAVTATEPHLRALLDALRKES